MKKILIFSGVTLAIFLVAASIHPLIAWIVGLSCITIGAAAVAIEAHL